MFRAFRRRIPVSAALALPAAALFLACGKDEPPPPPPGPPPREALHVFRKDAEWTLDHRASADLLVVGGGGGGGAECGGGGGGGGVLVATNVVLEPGRYRIRVGQGGAGGVSFGNTDSEQGSDGGPSSISVRSANGGEWVRFLALGGGGGGGFRGKDKDKVGRPGASGGGGCFSHAGGIALPGPDGVPQGHAGAASAPHRPGGGGGAGGPPDPLVVTDLKNAGWSGSGGPGVECSLSGTPTVYGAGGGGGAYNDHPGRAGGPGAGGGMPPGAESELVSRGQDGTGGGGGGGNNELIQGSYRGAPGGSGIVIVRTVPIGPVVALPEPGGPSAPSGPETAPRGGGGAPRRRAPAAAPLPPAMRRMRDGLLPGIVRRPFF